MKELTTLLGQNFVQRVLFFSFVFIFSFLSFAQEGEKDNRYGGYARLYSMGDNPYVVDPDNIKFNTAYSSIYSNFLWGDIGAQSYDNGPADGLGQFAAANFGIGNGITLGMLLSRNDFMTSYSIATLDPGDLVGLINDNFEGDVIVPLNNNMELMSSYKFGNYAVGLGLSYASSSREFTPAVGDGDEGTASQFGVNLGLIGKVSSSFNFDFAFSLLMPSASYNPGADGESTIEGSNTFILVNTRGYLKLSDKFSLVPAVNFYTGAGKVEIEGAPSVDLPTTMGVGVGVGLQYKMGNLLIAGGPAFFYDSETESSTETSPELESSSLTFPAWNLGAEWGFTEWLYGRLGYVARTFSSTSQSQESQTEVNEFSSTGFDEGDVRLGVGFRFGGFSLDATVNDDILRQGFNVIGGNVSSFAYLSASYAF
jgi:hypothetical protein